MSAADPSVLRPWFRFIATGASRRVVLIGRLAVKFPRVSSWLRMRQGQRCNLAELKEWRLRRYPHLCPILFADPLGLVVVMQRAEPVSFEEFDRWTESPDWPYIPHVVRAPFEMKHTDAGRLPDGRLVMVDYGAGGY